MFEGDPRLRVGTSSWSSKDWVGEFYPRGLESRRFIEHYGTVYDTVEIDSTFYGVPNPNTIDAWRGRTPDGFIFSAKVPRVVTHDKVLRDAGADMLEFLEIMSGLGDRLGPLVLQFPYFNRKAFPGPEPFFERLDAFLAELPRDFRYVVEVRNPRWVGRPLAEICRRHGVALAWVHQAWMPFPRQWPKLVGGPTAGFSYVRFLGDHKEIEKITKKWDRVVVDRESELREWLPIIRDLRDDGGDVFAYFNNHFAGNGPQTIELFRQLWRETASE